MFAAVVGSIKAHLSAHLSALSERKAGRRAERGGCRCPAAAPPLPISASGRSCRARRRLPRAWAAGDARDSRRARWCRSLDRQRQALEIGDDAAGAEGRQRKRVARRTPHRSTARRAGRRALGQFALILAGLGRQARTSAPTWRNSVVKVAEAFALGCGAVRPGISSHPSGLGWPGRPVQG